MRKTFIFGLMAAALSFTACSSEDDAVIGEKTQKKGMVLNANVEQPVETRATIDNSTTTWQFAFATGDKVSVTNSSDFANIDYVFTKGSTNFTSANAQPTTSPYKWFAFYPSKIIDLTNQTGELSGEGKSVANLYAMAGATTVDNTGENGLSITMQPQVAIIKIINNKGAIDIKVKENEYNEFVNHLEANDLAQFTMFTDPLESSRSILTKSETGTYYIVVPADFWPLTIMDGTTELRSTPTTGLTGGKYYELTIAGTSATTGTATAMINNSEVSVDWVQLWAGGPKFADRNVDETMTFTDAIKEGADYVWGANWCTPSKADMEHLYIAANAEYGGTPDDKVTGKYTTVNDIRGFKFTGKETGYTDNTVFFPLQNQYYSTNTALYWSSTVYSDDDAYQLYLAPTQLSNFFHVPKSNHYDVRPVLK